MTLIYVAGPLFTEGDRWLLEKIDAVCRDAGYDTYLPHRDAGLFTRDEGGSARFFADDVRRLDDAGLIVAVLNGADVDSGTAWEMGYMFALDKKIVGYLRDSRFYQPQQQLNVMIYNSLEALVDNVDDLGEVLERVGREM